MIFIQKLQLRAIVFALRHAAPRMGTSGKRMLSLAEEAYSLVKKRHYTSEDLNRASQIVAELKTLQPSTR